MSASTPTTIPARIKGIMGINSITHHGSSVNTLMLTSEKLNIIPHTPFPYVWVPFGVCRELPELQDLRCPNLCVRSERFPQKIWGFVFSSYSSQSLLTMILYHKMKLSQVLVLDVLHLIIMMMANAIISPEYM